MKRFCLKTLGFVGWLACLAVGLTPAHAAPAETNAALSVPYAQRADVQEFIRQMAATNGFGVAELTQVFARVRCNPAVLEGMKTPGSARPWFQYRTNFLNERRIAGGAAFVKTNALALAEAEKRYGVPPVIIAAILGIESDYARFPLRFKAIESLATLGFDYPPRAPYFRGELAHFLVLAREQKWDPLTVPSSRDGGLGMAQFMPRSYRRIAIDFDGDGQRNLLTNPADAIGSIANYLSLDGWRRGDGWLAVPARVEGTHYLAEVRRAFPAPRVGAHWRTAVDWRLYGVMPVVTVPAEQGMLLVELAGATSPEIWLVFRNFSVITGYNHNPMYALAASQLAQEISRRADPPRPPGSGQ